jgi:hypothetical protein
VIDTINCCYSFCTLTTLMLTLTLPPPSLALLMLALTPLMPSLTLTRQKVAERLMTAIFPCCTWFLSQVVHLTLPLPRVGCT